MDPHERAIYHQAVINSALKNAAAAAHEQTRRIIGRLKQFAESFESADAVRYTSWVALLHRDAQGAWKALGCYDSNNLPDELPESTVVLPIPDPASLQEFQGF